MDLHTECFLDAGILENENGLEDVTLSFEEAQEFAATELMAAIEEKAHLFTDEMRDLFSASMSDIKNALNRIQVAEPEQEATTSKKLPPTIDEVCEYARINIPSLVHKKMYFASKEHQDEAAQEAQLRVVSAFKNGIKADGWKAFTYWHCLGAIKDYLKRGLGDQESKWYQKSSRDKADGKATDSNNLRERVFMTSIEGDSLDVEQVLGMNEVFSEIEMDNPKINWELLSRMATTDLELLAFTKIIRGFTIQEISESFGTKRGIVVDLIKKFMIRMNSLRWQLQVLYAFGISADFGVRIKDQSEYTPDGTPDIGWVNDKTDLDSFDHVFLFHTNLPEKKLKFEEQNQMTLL